MFVKLFRIMCICLIIPTFLMSAGIATGSSTGTYIKIGQDISSFCSKEVLKDGLLDVFETKGSLENYKMLVSDANVKFIIVQFDVLEYMQSIKQKDAEKIKMVYPFYNEEIHILTSSKITVKKLSDLNNKKVVIGEASSGNWITSQLLISKGLLQWNTIELSPAKGVEALLQGDVDAVLIVSGAPNTLIQSLNKNSNISLANLQDPILDALYQRTQIKASTYPNLLNEDISTYSIKSILATYDYKKEQPSYERVQKLFSCINNNLLLLKQTGHPKWKEVEFDDYKKVKWDLHSAVKEFLDSSKNNLNVPLNMKDRVLKTLDNK